MVPATIQDVARRARVSIATVSNVLNAPERVRETTRSRVLEAIDELEFVPKAEAVARARRAIGRIGVVAPLSSYPSFHERLQGILEALRAEPFELVLYDQESVAVRHDYLSSLPLTRRLDGLIVMLPFEDRVAERLLGRELETVLVEFSRPQFSGVDIDNKAGGALAAEYLISRGHVRCAFVGERQVEHFVVTQSEDRLAGFRRALETAGLALPDEYVSLAPFGVEEARRQTHELLNLRTPPTAIFAHSDIQAIGVLKAARDRGLTVPGDLAIIGFDDLEVASHLGLTTIHQPLAESGRIAVELLLERLADPTRSVRSVRLPLSVVERETA
jgi:DNA-binding LacI/PurR family transcriptional regulator